jgi:hypothetical protein
MEHRVKLVALALVLVACGDDGAQAPVDAATDVSVDAATEVDAAVDAFVPASTRDYCEAIEPFFCAFYLRCDRMDVTTGEACAAAFLEKCNAVFEPRYVGLEAAGLLALDLEGIAACQAHLETVACEQQIQELSGACARILRGTQTAGEACGFDVESFTCEPGTQCVLSPSLCGECRVEVPTGQTCTPGTDTCAPTAFCDAGTCVARIANGSACTPDDRCMIGSACTGGVCRGPTYVARGESCDQARRCPYLTVCTGGTCQPTTAVGATCTNDGVCELGFCDAGTCRPPRDLGEPCDRPNACNTGLCDVTCQPRPSVCFPD